MDDGDAGACNFYSNEYNHNTYKNKGIAGREYPVWLCLFV